MSADTDTAQDIYERAGGVTTLVSTGPLGGNTGTVPVFAAVTPNGAHVFFTTQEQLVSADTDSAADLYERAGGTTRLSTGPDGGTARSTRATPAPRPTARASSFTRARRS